jgi:hypothetical protein
VSSFVNAKLKGTSTETHLKISSPEMSADDFVFKVPAGTLLKDSILGAGLPGK